MGLLDKMAKLASVLLAALLIMFLRGQERVNFNVFINYI
jgi:hypothetical protein